MNKFKMINALVMILVPLPIWLYLMYQIMLKVQATELMWFLFWVYAPVAVVTGIIAKYVEPSK